jgi:hypothetical protein
MTTRACLSCGTLFQVNPRTPRRRYCTPRCRAEAWRRRHPRAEASPPANPANPVNVVNGVAQADSVTNGVNAEPRANDATNDAANDAANDDRRATLARCPHCHTPIAVLTLLVPPAAAHVTTPKALNG